MESRRKSRLPILIVFCLWTCALGAQSSPSDLSGLNSDDRASIESACYLAKNLDGPAAYHSCLQEQLRALSGSQAPDLSRLSSDDRASIESACYLAKNMDGPAAYHSCLQEQLQASSGSKAAAELSGRSSVATQPTAPVPLSTTGLCAENGSCYGDLNANGVPKTVHVNGYYRKDGTYVRGHYRSAPGTNPRTK